MNASLHRDAQANNRTEGSPMLISQPVQHQARERGSIPRAVLALVLGALAMGAVGSSAAYAQEQANGDSLVSLMNGKCIEAEDVPGAASMPRVRMMSCSPTNANQRWTYSPATGEFKTAQNKCLDAYAMERIDPVIVYPCTGGKNQGWDTDSRGRIVMREAGPSGQRYCVTIANGDRSDGARLWLQTCHRGENQLFRRDPSGKGGSTVSIESDLRLPDHDPACVDVPARELGAVPGAPRPVVAHLCRFGRWQCQRRHRTCGQCGWQRPRSAGNRADHPLRRYGGRRSRRP
jgi:hypothetical protein